MKSVNLLVLAFILSLGACSHAKKSCCGSEKCSSEKCEDKDSCQKKQ